MGLQHRCFTVKFLKILRTPVLKTRCVNDCFCESPQGFRILMNIYRLFKFLTADRVWLHGTLQQVMRNASSLHMTQEKNQTILVQQVSKLVELNAISTLTFANKSLPPADKCILKVISDHTKSINIYLNSASCSSWNHCFECKVAVEVFSFGACLGNTWNSQ